MIFINLVKYYSLLTILNILIILYLFLSTKGANLPLDNLASLSLCPLYPILLFIIYNRFILFTMLFGMIHDTSILPEKMNTVHEIHSNNKI